MLSPTNMDPAEVERTLNAHTNLFTRLETYLEQADRRMDTLQQSLHSLNVQVRALSRQPSPVASTASATAFPAPPFALEPRIPAPKHYAGDPQGCRGFLNQCLIQFRLSPSRFVSSVSRVGYIVALLIDEALAWASPIWEQQGPLTQDIDLFVEEFRRVFDTPARQLTAASSLHHITQGDRPVARYAVEFRTLAAETGWNNEALSSAFWQSLSEPLKDELAARERPTNLEDLISLCVRVDQRLQERRNERSRYRQRVSRHLAPSFMAPTPPSGDIPEPMQLGGNKLSAAEKQRRRNAGLCMYCGNSGHILPQCPHKPGNANSQ
ncbi:hypothetical protein FKM82_022980 [Ascaphus truei]